jgi:polyisoprenoid-binding protein YceI
METLTKTKWGIDKAHSEIQFKARHLMITTVTVALKDYTSEIETEGDDFSKASISFTGELKSASSGNEQRDGHLQGADFFDTANHPTLRFVSSAMTKDSENEYTLKGKLTLKGVTKEVSFKAELTGTVKDPWGNTKTGFHVTGKINRKDFGISFNAVNETGGLLVGEEIKLDSELQLTKN